MHHPSDSAELQTNKTASPSCATCNGSGLCSACDEDRNAAVRRRCPDCSGEGDCQDCDGTGTTVKIAAVKV
jgi:DnaJ-class molecular chaperone